jgi:hypothetical protein
MWSKIKWHYLNWFHWFVVPGIEFRTSHMLGKGSYHWATHPAQIITQTCTFLVLSLYKFGDLKAQESKMLFISQEIIQCVKRLKIISCQKLFYPILKHLHFKLKYALALNAVLHFHLFAKVFIFILYIFFRDLVDNFFRSVFKLCTNIKMR